MALNNMGLGILINVAGNAAKELKGVSTGFTDVTNAAKNASKETQGFSQSFTKAINDDKVRQGLKSTGTALLGIGVAATGGVAVATKQFGDFQQQMLNVKATAGLTADAYDELSAFAIDVGAKTKYSASQVANSMYSITSAGYSATQEIKDLTVGIADFAAAGNIDLPAATTAITSALKAFQLQTKDTTRVADVFSQTISLSAFQAGELEQTFANIGSVANMLNQTIEQTSAGLMAMRNAGIGGSEAATSMKSAMMGLINPSAEAESMLQELGVQIRDAQGNMKSWPEIVGEFERSFNNIDPVIEKFRNAATMTTDQLDEFAKANHMTTGQLDTMIKASFQGAQAFKDIAMSTVFGTYGIRAMSTALNAETTAMKNGKEVTVQGAEALKEWERQLNNSSGRAAEMADIMNEGVNFAFEEMSGAAESASITFGERLEPATREVMKAVQGLFDWYNDLSPTMQSVIAYTVLLTGAFGILGGVSLLLLAQIPSMITGARLAGKAFMFMTTGAWRVIGPIVTMIGHYALVSMQLLLMAGRAIVMGGALLAQATVMGVVRGATMAWMAAQWLLNAALNANPIGLIITIIGGLILAFAAVMADGDTLKEKMMSIWTNIKNFFIDGVNFVIKALNKLIGAINLIPGIEIGKIPELEKAEMSIENTTKTVKDNVDNAKVSNGKVQIHGSHAMGLNRVPFDGYLAELHKDEMVVPAKPARQMRRERPAPPAPPQPGGIPADAIQQAVAAGAAIVQGATKAGQAAQIIQLVVDGQVLAQILAGIQGENNARAAAY